MCGRFTLRVEDEELSEFFDLSEEIRLSPRYNIAPSQQIVAVERNPSEEKKKLRLMHWGLIPSWSQDPKIAFRLINARSETVDTKPSFRDAFKSQRCLIPASGYYEWQKKGKDKIPFLISHVDDKLMAFAGIWDTWKKPNGQILRSCSILTTEAIPQLREIHARMPLILEEKNFDVWLSPKENPNRKLMSPYKAKALKAIAVSSYVNRTVNDDPRCLEQRREDPQMDLFI